MVSPVPVFVVNELLKANRQIDINLSACSTKRFPLCKFHHAHHRKHCVFACTKHMNGLCVPCVDSLELTSLVQISRSTLCSVMLHMQI